MASSIKNLDRLKRKLIAIPETAKEQIKIAMAQGAEEITDFMRRIVPVAPKNGGTLRDSIGWAWGAQPPAGTKVVGGAKAQGLQLVIFAGSDKAFYARFVEFGTPQHPANPFFFPAYRASRKRIKAAIGRAVRKAAKQEASRTA